MKNAMIRNPCFGLRIVILQCYFARKISDMLDTMTLPKWLDDFIFEELGAKYCRLNSNMTVIDWDKNDILNYLGTYFPRSYAEAYCIYSELFKSSNSPLKDKDAIRIFDFCCGTGGEIVGFITALADNCKNIKNVLIDALDGNDYGLRLSESVINELAKRIDVEIKYNVIPHRIDDFYDLDMVNVVMKDSYDIIMTFKAICEFVTIDRFDRQNPYQHITDFFLPRLSDGGIMLFVDLSSKNNTSQEWLPKQMDKGLSKCSCTILRRNEGYNQTFYVRHSRRTDCDVSKIVWRLVTKK